MRGVFVTGTGTAVGKTVVSAALLHRYRSRAHLRYWKPVQTGMPNDDDTAIVSALAACAVEEICARGVRLPGAFSPHLSARLLGTEIHPSPLVRLAEETHASRAWVIEGAGGVLVPVNRNKTMADFMADIGLPVLIVALSQLGTINHTLLTLEALRSRSLEIAGVVMNGSPNRENRQAIEEFGNVAVIGEMPPFDPLNPDVLGKWAKNELDPDGRIEQLFGA